jgi:DNA-binding NtrC family response regulator
VIERARELALVEGGSMKDIVRQATAELERDLIARALDETGGNVTHAARRLKISRKSLQIKMKELGLREVRDDSDEGRDVDDESEGGVGGGVS